MDQLVLATNQTYWHSHEAHEEAAADHDDHEGHDHAGHNHTEDHAPTSLMEEDPEKEITSLLVRYKNASSFQALNFPRNINENTELLAANPAYEISEVRRQFDSGQRILGVLVMAITIVSALSIFIALFTSLRERRYELALMRTMGAGRGKLFLLIIMEGLMVAVIGYLLGILLSHGIMAILAGNVQDDFRYTVSATRFLTEEGWLFAAALFIGFLAAVIPAVQASKTDIAETLTDS
jgi:putative ABC transport system permease protein